MELYSYNMPLKEIKVMPVGDIQWAGDSSHTALRMLKDHIQWGVDHDVWFIGMGDYIDHFSPSNRATIRAGKLYDTALEGIDQLAHMRVRELYEKALAPSKGRWLGLLEGHHFHQYKTGITSDMELAEMLGTVHLGTSAYVRLYFQQAKRDGGRADNVLIWAHHGHGSAQTPGAVLNKLQRVSARWEGDIFIMGHAHTKESTVIDRVIPIWNEPHRLAHRTVVLACTGGFLKGYVEHSRDGLVPRGTYVEQGMMPPVALGGMLFKITPRWHQGKFHRRVWLPDIRVES